MTADSRVKREEGKVYNKSEKFVFKNSKTFLSFQFFHGYKNLSDN